MLDPEQAAEKRNKACRRMLDIINEVAAKPLLDPYKSDTPLYTPPKTSFMAKIWMKIKLFIGVYNR